MITNLEPSRVLQQVRITFALRHDSFKIVLASEPEQPLAVLLDVVALKETLASFRNDCMKPELAVDQRQIAKVFVISESLVLLLSVRFGVFIPENVERVKERLGTPEQEITELWLAIWIKTYDLTVENAAATIQIASQSCTQIGEPLEGISVARDQPDVVCAGTQQRTEAVPLDLKEPIRIREWRTARDSGNGWK